MYPDTKMKFYSTLWSVLRNSRSTSSSMNVIYNYSTKSKEKTVNNKAVNEAEKTVGYPTSFLSLRWLLNDEVANVALHLRKLIGSNHPLLNTARDLIMNKQSPTWGLIVLLVSKAGGLNKEFSQVDRDMTAVLGNAKAEWTLRHLLDGASLLAKCCQGTLMLAEHPEWFQKLGYLFGRNMALAWQAHRDQTYFDSCKTDHPFSLVSAPLLFHIQHDPGYHKKILEYAKQDNIDYCEIRKVVTSGPGLKKTAELQEEFSSNALKVLEKFPDSEARTALVNIINSM